MGFWPGAVFQHVSELFSQDVPGMTRKLTAANVFCIQYPSTAHMHMRRVLRSMRFASLIPTGSYLCRLVTRDDGVRCAADESFAAL